MTPTPSSATSQLLQTPVGTVSLFGFKTPIPYPFGAERTGYLVTDIDAAVKAAQAAGADVLVAPFPEPIGRDVVIQWPGGVNMQLYWHTTKPNYAAFQTVPENRVYVSRDRADAFDCQDDLHLEVLGYRRRDGDQQGRGEGREGRQGDDHRDHRQREGREVHGHREVSGRRRLRSESADFDRGGKGNAVC